MQRLVQTILIPCLGLLGILSSPTYASEACAPETHTHQQCQFTSPALKHQQTKLVTASTALGFAGDVAVACRNGKVQWGAAACEPAAPSDCNIPATRFLAGKHLCSHAAHAAPLKDGQQRQGLDDQGKGEVLYQCDGGELKALSATCGGEAAELGAPIKGQAATAMLRTQNATTLKTGIHRMKVPGKTQPTASQVRDQPRQPAMA